MLNRALVALTLLLGGLLVALAVPSLLASIVALPGDNVLAQVRKRDPIAGHALDVLVASRRSVLALVASARAESDLGYALLMQAQMSKNPIVLDAAIDALHHSVSNAPARPYAWARLAYALLMRDGPSSRVADALHMAIVTAPEYGPPYDGLLVDRVALCLAVLPYFAADDQKLVHDQLRLAWWREREQTMRIVLATGSIHELAVALRDYPDDIAELRRLNLL